MNIKVLLLGLLLQQKQQGAFSFLGTLPGPHNVTQTHWSGCLRKGEVDCLQQRRPRKSSVQRMKMALFSMESLSLSSASLSKSPGTKTKRKRGKLMQAVSSFWIFPFFALPSSKARASTIAPQVKSIMSKMPWKRVFTGVVAMIAVSSSIQSYQVKKRQERLATSEWGRYAKHPMARGTFYVCDCIGCMHGVEEVSH